MNKPILLDTHAFHWLALGDEQLPVRLRSAAVGAPLYVSAVAAWELAIHVRNGRLTFLPTLPVWFEQALVALPAKVVPLTHEIAFQGEALPAFHGDPADRFHVATALVNRYRLMTVDGKIEAWAKKGPGKALGLTIV